MGSEFSFQGRIPPSKSLLNRWLCVGSYARDGGLKILGDSTCDDVVKMRGVLESLARGEPSDCGAAGTVLRFAALRASRLSGRHELRGSARLFERPQTELLHLLSMLGVRAELTPRSLVIDSAGWKDPGGEILVDRSASSQFASGLLLNAWELDFPLNVKSSERSVSDAYLEMTLAVVRQAGMKVEIRPGGWRVAAHQCVSATKAHPEPDMSSAFAVAALAAVGGKAVLESFPETSLQPDFVFLEILQRMGAHVKREASSVHIQKAPLKGVEWNLRDCPDLFPVLGVLCALAEGPSRLYGAEHLVHKESNRIAHTATLIRRLGREVIEAGDGLRISAGSLPQASLAFDYDSDEDHRLVMAGAVARWAGFDVNILRPNCVAKSYPEFLQIAEIPSAGKVSI